MDEVGDVGVTAAAVISEATSKRMVAPFLA